MRTEFDGINDGRMSSRVLAAPGGESSLGGSAHDRIAAMKARRDVAAPPLANSAAINMHHGARPF